ncbi:MAG TPA: hypothetical protein VLK29_01360 [Luteimonas sp.]|nr:hypothetical protein [Luteimonas sp.]
MSRRADVLATTGLADGVGVAPGLHDAGRAGAMPCVAEVDRHG